MSEREELLGQAVATAVCACCFKSTLVSSAGHITHMNATEGVPQESKYQNIIHQNTPSHLSAPFHSAHSLSDRAPSAAIRHWALDYH